MPSFDIVSEVDRHELMNAVDQINREVTTRFDFKGSDAKVELKDFVMNFEATSDFQLKQMRDIMVNKFSKRKIDTRSLDRGKVEERGLRAYQGITVKQGIDQEAAKKAAREAAHRAKDEQAEAKKTTRKVVASPNTNT